VNSSDPDSSDCPVALSLSLPAGPRLDQAGSEAHAERPDKPEEACGVFGVMAPQQAVANLTYFGLYALQHRGQESAGIAVFEGSRVRLHKDMGLVSQVFDQDVLERMPGELAIGHNR